MLEIHFHFNRGKAARMRRENQTFFRSSFQWKRLGIMVNQYVPSLVEGEKFDWGGS